MYAQTYTGTPKNPSEWRPKIVQERGKKKKIPYYNIILKNMDHLMQE